MFLFGEHFSSEVRPSRGHKELSDRGQVISTRLEGPRILLAVIEEKFRSQAIHILRRSEHDLMRPIDVRDWRTQPSQS